MLRFGYALALGLVGAGIVHIAILFLLPQFSERAAWSRLAVSHELYDVGPLDPEAGRTPVLRSVDPLFLAAACRFDLADGPLRLTASGAVPFWSVSVYDRNGRNLYSLNDRAVQGRALDMIVLTPAQTVLLRKEMPEGMDGALFIEASVGEGIVVMRAFVPDETWRGTVRAFLDGIGCRPAPIG